MNEWTIGRDKRKMQPIQFFKYSYLSVRRRQMKLMHLYIIHLYLGFCRLWNTLNNRLFMKYELNYF